MRGVRTAAALAALIAAGCSGGDEPRQTAPVGDRAADRESVRSGPPRIKPFEPNAAEVFPNGKRLAGRVAQRALTYRRGTTAHQVAAALPASRVGAARLARVLRPAVEPDAWSAAEVVYPQLSGVTATSLGAMVVVRQTTERADGRRRTLTRVVDVRLRRSGGPWSLDNIGSIGGSPVRRPEELSAAGRRVLDSPAIELSDSARWDIHRGRVDDALLRVLARAATRREFAVAVFRAGHPHNVWATDRPSAHSSGLAADIYAVGGRPLITQRSPDTPAYELAEELFAGGAFQLGSPWVFGAGGPRSFSDPVHQDHIHVQQSPLP